ncbi:hypothetical protein DES39_2144 [Orbus hercynius]|uniref:Uncharacterized protein n=1 Tax=Orbus hercynius TaxID=593135 RepID=A0A495RBT0_9GAMM|nr:hypothetical protein [Orbus hercynius]RKS84468.1 hypothetical protein DES39_2144 [Orbus hercynius]
MLKFMQGRIIKCSAVLITSLLLLTACRDDVAIKQLLQNNYDKKNASGQKAFCVRLGGAISFPYTTQYMHPKQAVDQSSRYNYIWNKKLNERLPLFSRLGLFEQKLLISTEQPHVGEAIYRYSLTDSGKKYLTQWVDTTALCFGRRVIVDVLSDTVSKDRWGDEVVSVQFSYIVEGVPEWATDPQVNEMFDFNSFGLNTDGGISTGSLFFRDTANGLRISGGPAGMWLFW